MYRKIASDDAPRRERKSESRFESTPEWKSLKKDIDKGIKPGESCLLQFSKEDWERIGLSGEAQAGRNTSTGSKAVRRFVQKYLDTNHLMYATRAIHNDEFDYIIVDGPVKSAR